MNVVVLLKNYYPIIKPRKRKILNLQEQIKLYSIICYKKENKERREKLHRKLIHLLPVKSKQLHIKFNHKQIFAFELIEPINFIYYLNNSIYNSKIKYINYRSDFINKSYIIQLYINEFSVLEHSIYDFINYVNINQNEFKYNLEKLIFELT